MKPFSVLGAVVAVVVTSVLACSSSDPAAPNPTLGDGGAATEPAPAVPTAAPDAAPKPKSGTCDAAHACTAKSECLTAGSDQGFCAATCDPTRKSCGAGQRCAAFSGGRYCLDECSADADCGAGFLCTKSVGAVLGKFACVRSCEGLASYCGAATCKEGLCPPKLVCDPSGSGLDASKTLVALTSNERGTMCDFTACPFGAYGQSKSCGTGSKASGPESQSFCKSEAVWTACGSVLVGEYEACQKKLNADPCKALHTFTTDPDCAPLKACAM